MGVNDMKIGLVTRFGDKGARDVGYLKAFAQAVEAAGFSTLYLPEHVVFFAPEDYESKYPYSKDGTPPFDETIGLFDPLIAFAAVGGAATRLRFATSVMILPERPALLTAKEVMTLDHILEGRFDFGVGVGWSKEEYEALGVSFARRGKRMDEYIAAMKAVWRGEKASLEGEFVSFKNVIMLPKPHSPGGPPLLIGGDSEAAMRRAARIGDGWYGWWNNTDLPPHIEKFRALMAEEGRDIDNGFSFRVGAPHRGEPPETLADKVALCKQLGVHEMPLALPVRPDHFEEDIPFWASAAGLPS